MNKPKRLPVPRDRNEVSDEPPLDILTEFGPDKRQVRVKSPKEVTFDELMKLDELQEQTATLKIMVEVIQTIDPQWTREVLSQLSEFEIGHLYARVMIEKRSAANNIFPRKK